MNTWEEVRSYACVLIFGVLIGWLCGWIHAHGAISSECKKLESFYVGDTVFNCKQREPRP